MTTEETAQQLDPYAKLKKAHAEGKVIECITGTDRRWMAMQGEPRWFLPVEDYRIKPEDAFQLPPPPPGMQWHRTDGWQDSEKKPDDETMPDFSDNEILQLRQLLNYFSPLISNLNKMGKP